MIRATLLFAVAGALKGTKTATLKLKAGKYKYYCPNHESIMFHHFTLKS